MTPVEFIQAGQKIVGKQRGYQPPLARKLGVSLTTVKRYASGYSFVPQTIKLMINELLK